MKERQYSIKELVKILGVTRVTVTKYLANGLIESTFNQEKGMYEVSESAVKKAKIDFHRGEKTYTFMEMGELLNVRPQTLGKYASEGRIKTYILPTGQPVVPEAEVKRIKKLQSVNKYPNRIGQFI